MKSNSILLEKAKNGDKPAEDELVENNMGLVISAAKRFINRGYDFEELTQVGSIGLIKAIKRFDTSFDVQFSTYAVPMIMGEIKRHLRDDGIIKVSRSLKETSMRARAAAERLTKELSREPTVGEIASAVGVSADELVMAMDATVAPESINATVTEDGKPLETSPNISK